MTTTTLFMAFLLGLLAFANRRYEKAPAPRPVARMARAESAWLKWRFLRNIEQAIEVNDHKLRWKSRFLTAALLALFATVTSLGGYSFYRLVF